jgi:hypothetical protein
MANLIFSILSEYNGKGLAKGKKDLTAFEKQTKQLGKTLAKYLGAAALVSFGKKAVMAFAADEKAAKSLELQLKNTGFAFSSPNVEYYIANLQKLYGVLDDELRPAFQTLLTASGSITKSQAALSTALNVSAATGKSVQEVSQALAKGFTGQTTALTRLGAGLSKATLASGDMNKIMAELDAKFAGQAAARLETYAGKMDQLKVAAADATEIIGKGLLDALGKLSGDTTLSNFSDYVNHLATNIAKLVSGLGRFASTLKPGNMVKVNGEYRLKSEIPKSNFTYSLGSGAGVELAKIQEKKKIKEAISLRTQENNLLKKKTAVDELRDKFDLERIGLTAALNSATDDETKLRLKAQLAILDNNEALAKKYLAEMNAAENIKKLAESTVLATSTIITAAETLFARLNLAQDNSLFNQPSNAIASNYTGNMGTNVVNGNNSLFNQPSNNQGSNYTNVTLELAPNAGEFGQLIYNSFLINQRDGKSQLYNGGIKGG